MVNARAVAGRGAPLVALATLLTGCCTAGPCLDRLSGADRQRVKATRLEIGVVHNDRVSSPKRDRTDWKFVELSQPGKLTVQLHWDQGGSQLELAVFDVLGVEIQQGRVWGAGGLRAVVAVEEAGRYYIRVRGRGKKDASNYSLRLRFKPDRGTAICHDCKEGQRKCLGERGYVICEKIGKGCNAWSKSVSCEKGSPCVEGVCKAAKGCKNQCSDGEHRCEGAKGYQVCRKNAKGCYVWSDVKRCPRGRRCRRGRCRGPKKPTHTPTVQKKPPKKSLRAKIISIYRYRGRMTLHIEIGNHPVKPGQTGVVLSGTSNKPLPGGEIKVLKVSGRYAIATTSLTKLGKNRWIRLDAR